MDTIHPADALRRRAQDAGITMKDICQRAGVAESTPSRWSQWEPKLSTIRKLETALSELIAEALPVEA